MRISVWATALLAAGCSVDTAGLRPETERGLDAGADSAVQPGLDAGPGPMPDGGEDASRGCPPDRDDCDSDRLNGCETMLRTDTDCSGCGDACGAGPCVDGACVACEAGCECVQSCTEGSACGCSDGCDCALDCPSDDCTVECSDLGTVCTATDGEGDVTVTCTGGAHCTVEAGGSNLYGSCSGVGTRCDIDCTGASNCKDLRCVMGAVCTLDCTGVDRSNCDFMGCDGVRMECGNLVACGLLTCP
jgi:hypothetical protein